MNEHSKRIKQYKEAIKTAEEVLALLHRSRVEELRGKIRVEELRGKIGEANAEFLEANRVGKLREKLEKADRVLLLSGIKYEEQFQESYVKGVKLNTRLEEA